MQIVTRVTGVVHPSGIEVGVASSGGVEVRIVHPGGVEVSVASPGCVGWAATTAVPHGGLG